MASDRVVAKLRKRFLKITRRDPGGCLIWTGYIKHDGYGRFGAAGEGGVAHRAAWELFVGPIPAGMMVLHSCDNRRCVDWEAHLFLGTGSDNVQDCLAKRRFRPRKGASHPRGRLTDETVCAIRELAGTMSQKKIADQFGVNPATVSKILSNRARQAV